MMLPSRLDCPLSLKTPNMENTGFNDYVKIMFSRRYQLEQESRALAVQRDALLPKLVSGKVHVELE